jgi:hypothetical protein
MLNRQANSKTREKFTSFPSDWYRKLVVTQKQRIKDRKESSPKASTGVTDISKLKMKILRQCFFVANN